MKRWPISNASRNLLDTAAPNPSVETLLHAFIDAKFIDHTHAVAILALADQPDAVALLASVPPCVACVLGLMPGFDLAPRGARIWRGDRDVEGLILVNHGVFSFGASARESYERMISLVTVAENFITSQPPPRARPRAVKPGLRAADALPILRGVLAKGAGERFASRWILDLRSGERARALVDHPNLTDLATRGVATPDHVIRTKHSPLVLPVPGGDRASWRAAASQALAAFMNRYEAYFAANASRAATPKTPLDPLPRVLAIPGLGLAGVGRNAIEAAVAADIAASWAATLLAAEAVGRFTPVGEAETFDLEYWSLEQAKLGSVKDRRLERHVVVVTGAAGAIGAATARAFAAEGAEVARLDIAPLQVADAGLAAPCDVTDETSVTAAFATVCERFGGVDIVVSNAGSALPGMMAQFDKDALQDSFDVNFFAHQTVAREAVGVFRAQGMGGVLLFNVSKQAVNPGPGFGAYGAAKAALLALVRQYALEHGPDGVRVNALNPDRIRSGLLTPAMIADRSAARGVSEEAYMVGNLLGQEVTAEDVAQAFVFAALDEAHHGRGDHCRWRQCRGHDAVGPEMAASRRGRSGLHPHPRSGGGGECEHRR